MRPTVEEGLRQWACRSWRVAVGLRQGQTQSGRVLTLRMPTGGALLRMPTAARLFSLAEIAGRRGNSKCISVAGSNKDATADFQIDLGGDRLVARLLAVIYFRDQRHRYSDACDADVVLHEWLEQPCCQHGHGIPGPLSMSARADEL